MEKFKGLVFPFILFLLIFVCVTCVYAFIFLLKNFLAALHGFGGALVP